MEGPVKPAYILGDRIRLAQVFENILCNALQFTEAPGHVSVSMRVDRKQAVISFTDDGAGFEPEFVKTMFEPFTQAPQDLGRRQGGLGLGLAIAKAIAELHEGSLDAVSPGSSKGATFKLSLPLEVQAHDSRDAGNGKLRANPRMRVLVIEDNRDFSQLFRDMLQIMGCDPDAASTGRSGLEIAKKTLPDMIFCDIGLPGDMNGFDFACAVRADEALAHIPLIAVSGYTRDQDREHAASAGFDRVFPKPVKFADINEALETFSKRKRSGK
jgi:CheY-like chemotaxis protein